MGLLLAGAVVGGTQVDEARAYKEYDSYIKVRTRAEIPRVNDARLVLAKYARRIPLFHYSLSFSLSLFYVQRDHHRVVHIYIYILVCPRTGGWRECIVE